MSLEGIASSVLSDMQNALQISLYLGTKNGWWFGHFQNRLTETPVSADYQ